MAAAKDLLQKISVHCQINDTVMWPNRKTTARHDDVLEQRLLFVTGSHSTMLAYWVPYLVSLCTAGHALQQAPHDADQGHCATNPPVKSTGKNPHTDEVFCNAIQCR